MPSPSSTESENLHCLYGRPNQGQRGFPVTFPHLSHCHPLLLRILRPPKAVHLPVLKSELQGNCSSPSYLLIQPFLGKETVLLIDLAPRRGAEAQSGRRRRSGTPSRRRARASFLYSSNEDGGGVGDLRGVAGRRRGRRRRWRALLEGPLTIAATDRVAQPSDDTPCSFTPRRST